MAGGGNHWHGCSTFSNALDDVRSELDKIKKKLTKEQSLSLQTTAAGTP